MKEGEIQPFGAQSSSSVSYGSSLIIFLPVLAYILILVSQFFKLNVRKSWSVLNLGVVFFDIVSRLLRRCTTTDGGHGSIERDFSFSLFPRQVAVEMVEKEEEVVVVLVENKNEEVEKKENVQVEVVEKEVNERHRSKKKESHHHYHLHLYHHHYYHVRDNHRCRLRHRLMDQQKLTADNLSNLSSFDTTTAKVVGIGNEIRRINRVSPDPRQESFPAPEERTFDHQYAEQVYHRPDPSAPPLPKSYENIPFPGTIRRVDAFSFRPQEISSPELLSRRTQPQRPPPLQQTELQPLKSKKIPLPPPPPPLPQPRRRKEREERRIIIQSKKYKKEESGKSRFQSVISPNTPSSQPKQPPPTKIEPSLPPSQSFIAQSLFQQIQHPPPPPAPSASFLQKLLKLNNNKKKVNLKAAPPPPPPPTSSVLQHLFRKSSTTKKTLSDSSLPSLPSWDSHQNPAPEAAKLIKRSTGKPPLPPQTKMLIKKRRNTNRHPKREIYWNIGSQSPLGGIPPPPPLPPFPTPGMKFVARGDLVKIQSSSSDFPDDPPSTPCDSSSDVNIKAKYFIDRTRAGFQQELNSSRHE